MGDCIFCKIVSGDIPSEPLFASERVLAFRDISPQAPVHVLVIPKQHCSTMNDFPDDAQLALEMIQAVAHITQSEGIAESGYRVIVNAGHDGGQEVDHVHWHILGGRPLGMMLT